MQSDKQITALVTGVGAVVGYGIIKSLRLSGFPVRIVGTDIYSDAVGQFWCDDFIRAPYAVDESYVPFLKKTIEERSIDIVFFGTEQEIERCYKAKDDLGSSYCRLVINRGDLIEISRDKWVTREALLDNDLGVIAIPSVIEGDYCQIAEMWGPRFILKPRRSYASKGIHIVDNEHDFLFYKEKMGDDFMAQKLIGDTDHEYTVGVFGLGDGRHAGSISFQRTLNRDGATAKAKTVFFDDLDRIVNNICQSFRPVGPTNLQFRKDGQKFFLLEINPRISSSTSIRAALGFNEAEMCMQYYLDGIEPSPVPKAGRAIRFIDEVVIEG